LELFDFTVGDDEEILAVVRPSETDVAIYGDIYWDVDEQLATATVVDSNGSRIGTSGDSITLRGVFSPMILVVEWSY
jgi:hypothetical protein